MSFIGGLFSGGKGSNFQGQGTQIDQALGVPQAQQAYNRNEGALNQQQAFVNALGGQNGLGNQSSVFDQQQALAGQLQGVANGTGPNPAQAALAQATGQNVAQQAALMASQRGVGANPGLLARQAAQQGAGIQQQSAGQAATMQAQQQLNALGQLQQQQANMGNLATQQVGQQQQGLSALNQGAAQQQGATQDALNAANQARINMQSNINSSNAGIAAQNAGNQASGLGSLLGGAAGAVAGPLGSIFGKGKAFGGAIEKPMYAEGGPVSRVGNYLKFGAANPSAPNFGPVNVNMKGAMEKAFTGAQNAFAPTPPIEPTPVGAPRAAMMPVPALAKGGNVKKPIKGEETAAKGKMVPGKAKAKGDSYANDTVDAKLSPGEIIIPRSIAQHPDAANLAAKFVAAVKAKKGLR